MWAGYLREQLDRRRGRKGRADRVNGEHDRES
jgi:hypothetical protein